MKVALNHLNTIEIHMLGFDYNIGGGSDGPTAADQELPTGPDAAFSPAIEKSVY